MDRINAFLPDILQTLLVFLIIIGTTMLANLLARRGYTRVMRKSEDNADLTSYKFVGNALTAIIYSIGIIFAIREIPPLRTFAGSLLAGAGILAAIVGFASQQAFSNIVSGIFIVLSKPFRVNDRLKIKEIYNGVVEDITLRHTVIRDFENRRIIIPNAVINNEILVNADYNDDPVCKFVEFAIGFNTDLDLAKSIMSEEIGNHPLQLDRRSELEKEESSLKVVIRLVRITEWALILRGDAWAQNPPKAFELYCDLLESIKRRFDIEGIEMPSPRYIIDQKNRAEQ